MQQVLPATWVAGYLPGIWVTVLDLGTRFELYCLHYVGVSVQAWYMQLAIFRR